MLIVSEVYVESFVYAEGKVKCNFKVDCKNSGRHFSLNFESKTGCEDTDMTVNFETKARTQALAIKPDWYLYTESVSKTPRSICEGTREINKFPAYSWSKDRILFFIKTYGYSAYDSITAVLLNSDSGEVIDSKVIGRSKNQFIAVLKEKEGFKIRIVNDEESKALVKVVSCDCDAAFVDSWMKITVSDDKIITGWL